MTSLLKESVPVDQKDITSVNAQGEVVKSKEKMRQNIWLPLAMTILNSNKGPAFGGGGGGPQGFPFMGGLPS